MQHTQAEQQRKGSGGERLSVMRWGRAGVLAAVLLLPLRVGALGSGDLDTSFSNDGMVTTDFAGGRANSAAAVALQPDGKIVVVGSAVNSGGTSDFAVARYNPNGTLDTSFSGDGKVTTSIDYQEYGTAVALQPDGKIVVAGLYQHVSGRQAFALVRYLPNGTLDTSFDDDGKVITNFTNESNDGAYAVAIQANGKIVVAGYSEDASFNSDFALARYHAHTCNGVVVTRIGTNSNDVIMGTSGPDVVYAFGGNDLVDGLGGNDILCGGTGNDTLRGGSGTDILRGEADTDTCDGGTGGGDTATACETVTNVP